MRTRIIILLSALALVVAACGAGETSGSSAPDSTIPAAEAPEAMLLSYELTAGQTLSYEVDLDQAIKMSMEGDPSALGASGGEDVPGEMDLKITGTTTFTHSVAEGPEPGTYEITITGDLSDLEFGGTVDGAPVEDFSEVPDMAGMDPVDLTVIVDSQGNIIPDESGVGQDFLNGFGGLDMLGQLGPGSAGGVGQFVGPPFSEDEVTVGDTWSETIEIPTMPGDDPITTDVDSQVVGVEELAGAEVFVIETTTSTSAVEFDLAQLLIGFMTAFVPEDASEEELAQIDAIADELRFAFSVDPQVADMTTWFDFEAGLTRQADMTSATHMVMDINIPDEQTGELVEMGLDMSIDQDITYRLINTDEA